MPTKIDIKNLLVGYQSVISNGTHGLLADEPLSSNGTDLGFSPENLLVAALAACKVITVRYHARKNNWPVGEVNATLELDVQRGEGGKKMSNVRIDLQIEGALTEEQKQELYRQADHCYIHRLLSGEWSIEALAGE